MIGRARRIEGQAGMSLAEVLVAMTLTSILTLLLVAGSRTVYRAYNYQSQDSTGLGALRTAIDRFEKEVRQARRMYSGSTAKKVVMWVDYDHDNQQDPSERITWEIEDLGGGRAQLTRATQADASARVVTGSFVFDAAASDFVYNAADPVDATLITVTFVARADGHLSGERTMRTEVRLRNATAV